MDNSTKTNEKTKLLCPQCGGNMEIETQEGQQLLSCPFCGYSEVYEKELTIDEKIVLAHRLAHARESARLRAQEEYESRQKKNAAKRIVWKQSSLPIWAKTLIPLVVVWLVIGAIILFSRCNPTKKTVDPFQYVEVTFYGTDGEGKAACRKLPVDGKENDINYSFSSNSWLSEGDAITLTASGRSYNLKNRKETYIVSGLDLYVTDASQLDEAAKAALSELSEKAIRVGFDGVEDYSWWVFEKRYDSYSARLVSRTLLSDGQRENSILDVYELTFTMGEETGVAYAGYEMTGVILRRNGEQPVAVKDGQFAGDYVYIGDGRGWGDRYMGTMTGFLSREAVDLYVQEQAAQHSYTIIQTIQDGE